MEPMQVSLYPGVIYVRDQWGTEENMRSASQISALSSTRDVTPGKLPSVPQLPAKVHPLAEEYIGLHEITRVKHLDRAMRVGTERYQ